MKNWWVFTACSVHAAMWFLQWLPAVLVVVVVAVILTDPGLLFSMGYEVLCLIPAAIRARFLSAPAATTVQHMPLGPHSRLMTVADAAAPPAFAHPSFVPAASGGTEVAVGAFSGGGAALLLHWVLSRHPPSSEAPRVV